VINKIVGFALVAALLAAVAMANFWYHEKKSLDATRSKFVLGELQPIASLLQGDQLIIKDLQEASISEKDSGILESYLAMIRRDGLSKHADMKQRLDTLAENNTEIVTLIKAYVPNAKTPAFTMEADRFRYYAAAWRDRWNSLMELFMAGGNYASAEVPFPEGFPHAVQTEIDAAK
jgi:hypothetical protein